MIEKTPYFYILKKENFSRKISAAGFILKEVADQNFCIFKHFIFPSVGFEKSALQPP